MPKQPITPGFDSRAFDARIAALCKERGTTVNQVALEAGVTPNKLYAPLRSPNPSAEAIGVILRAFGLTWAFLDTIDESKV